MNRLAKQLIVAAVFAALTGGVFYGLYAIYSVKPTCTDGIQNQKEEGIDCGPVCGNLCAAAVVPLQVQTSKLLSAGAGSYDFIAKIFNPNGIWGTGRASYDILYQDSAGQTVQKESGSFYITPNQTRYLVRTAVQPAGNPSQASLVIKDVDWLKVNSADTQIDFTLRREQYTDKGEAGADYQAVLFNDSDFDFDRVEVNIILFDESGGIVGVNKTVINTFLSKTERFFTAQWPFAISSRTPKAQVSATTNVFENGNFIKRYGTQEEFQKSYQVR